MAPSLAAHFTRRFRNGPTIRCALDIALDSGVTVLFGPSGSGKTTILRCLAGVDYPDEGSISFDSEHWFNRRESIAVPPERRKLGLLHQDFALFPHLSVAANIAYGLARLARTDRQRLVTELLDMMGIASLANRRPNQLSGGEQQRVALARALAPNPRLLLLDEPLSGLDLASRTHIRGELRDMLRRLAIPTIVVTHDRAEALTLGDHVALIVNGTIRAHGSASQVYRIPPDGESARALGFDNILPISLVKATATEVVVSFDKHTARIPANTALIGEGVEPSLTPAAMCIRGENVILTPTSNTPHTSLDIPGEIESSHDEGAVTRQVVRVAGELRVAALVGPDAPRFLVGDSVRIGFRPGTVCIVKAKP